MKPIRSVMVRAAAGLARAGAGWAILPLGILLGCGPSSSDPVAPPELEVGQVQQAAACDDVVGSPTKNCGAGTSEPCGHCAGTCKVNTALNGSVCRGAAGACDFAEKCGGTITACPADIKYGNSTTCRAAADECDQAEVCNGASNTCGTDLKKANLTACADDGNACTTDRCNGTSDVCQHAAGNAGSTCRAAAGTCDEAETCTGASATCPADVVTVGGTLCRSAAGACDVDDFCDGSSVDCADSFQPSTLECRASAGFCDVAESCTGTAAACPADGFQPGSLLCRAATDECDAAENCSGSSATCPADGMKPNGTACTADTEICTADKCNGVSAACQHPPAAAGTLCRSASGACDAAETCDGAATVCPADSVKANGVACADDGNPCTADTCNGSTTTCQHAAGNAGAVCRVASDVCDAVELCDGASTSCPADGFVAGGTVCRVSIGGCDPQESCSGSAASCPVDAVKADGSACDDANLCTSADACESGLCVGTAVVCTAPDACHIAGSCDPTTGSCTTPVQVASCLEASLDYVRVSVEYTIDQPVTPIAECNATNNWSATKATPAYVCGSVPNVLPPVPFTVTRVFQAACPTDQGPSWRSFSYTTSTPTDTQVEFRLRTFAAVNGTCTPLTAATADPPVPIAIASLTDDPEVCSAATGAPCPMDLFEYLGASWEARLPCLQMDVQGVPSTVNSPVLYDWSATYACEPVR